MHLPCSLSLSEAALLLPLAPHKTPSEDANFLPAYVLIDWLVVYQCEHVAAGPGLPQSLPWQVHLLKHGSSPGPGQPQSNLTRTH